MRTVVVSGTFDDLRSRHVRFLQEASRLGGVHVVLWSDRDIQAATGKPPKFPREEREYLLQAIRYVERVTLSSSLDNPDAIPDLESLSPRPQIWAVDEESDTAGKKCFCETHDLEYQVLTRDRLQGFPCESPSANSDHPGREKVIVTGCFDWFHSGHVRFFEEVSTLGDLYVVVGHDANIHLLKGKGHPVFPEEERRYMVHAVRFVTEALVSTGQGWLDAEPEMLMLKPNIYAVNEDGNQPEKEQFCKAHGIRYLVLKRTPKKGLQKRSSTDLRGF
jgi:cytidyltransferase-like protein